MHRARYLFLESKMKIGTYKVESFSQDWGCDFASGSGTFERVKITCTSCGFVNKTHHDLHSILRLETPEDLLGWASKEAGHGFGCKLMKSLY